MEYYIGVALAPCSTIDTGIAVLDENNDLILVDKFYTVKDIQHFFDNFSSLKQTNLCMSIPWDNTMLEGKWRILSKPYQMIQANHEFLNRDNWTERYSSRACEYFNSIKENLVSFNRFELYLTRQAMHLNSCFKERSPADCKFLQNVLKLVHGFYDLPTNMMPMSQLEAIVGALLAKEHRKNPEKTKKIFEFNNANVINTL